MALNVPVFFKRLGTSVVFVAVMLTGLLYNEWTFFSLLLVINFLCLREYFRMIKRIDTNSYWPKWLPAVFQILSFALIVYGMSLWSLSVYDYKTTSNHYFYFYVVVYSHMTYVVFLLFFMPVLLLLLGMVSANKYSSSVLKSLAGLAYISLSLFFLFCIYKAGHYLPLVLICLIWSNDTMAYLFGSFFGKTPFSSISPKKTWEGTIGGALITIIAAALVGYFTHTLTVTDWVMLAMCATIAGTFGDLLESKLKRMADVKDSGALMPGHGGALDRFDSLLIATPFAFVYVIYFMS